MAPATLGTSGSREPLSKKQSWDLVTDVLYGEWADLYDTELLPVGPGPFTEHLLALTSS